MPSNGDTNRVIKVNGVDVHGLGSFHKTLPHNQFGEVIAASFDALKTASADRTPNPPFGAVPAGSRPDCMSAALTNPRAGLADDRLTSKPEAYDMPPAPPVLSVTTGAEMTELYWMALLRDEPLDTLTETAEASRAPAEIAAQYAAAQKAEAHLLEGVDLPDSGISASNVFRMGLPDEDKGPLVSQFFLRPCHYGTQTIDQRQRPYRKELDFLTSFQDWLEAQDLGRDADCQDYPKSNEYSRGNFDTHDRYISTMRDLARFVNKDALHQAYFNAALVLLSGGAEWTPGNPYVKGGRLAPREVGFGVLGGPHILALVSEVATRALKIVWFQKWQTHLRLRPEAYGGALHMQAIGHMGTKRPYGLQGVGPKAMAEIRKQNKARNVRDEETLLLPMAFTAGSPVHPAYGAGHATVAGACVTILKAYFRIRDKDGKPLPFLSLREREGGFGTSAEISTWETSVGTGPDGADIGIRRPLGREVAKTLTIEGELNKLAANVALGRSMGGVHWRTDNTRSLILGEAIAARLLADISVDVVEKPIFTFHSFRRDAAGNPYRIVIAAGKVTCITDGGPVDVGTEGSAFSSVYPNYS